MTFNIHGKSNGTIVQWEKFVPHSYESLRLSDKKNISQVAYAECIAWYEMISDITAQKIKYMSDGLEVIGFIVKPQKDNLKKLPVIIYCRGGSNDDGRILVTTLKNRIYPLVQAGYVVLATQYRGNDVENQTNLDQNDFGSVDDTKDQCGGSEVHDVTALFDMIKNLDYVDQNNIYMVAYSRGPIDMYQVIKAGYTPNAVTTIAGIVDLFQFQQERPEATELLESMIPNLPEQFDAEYKKRSAIFWADKIKVPVLLLHGTADTISRVTQSEKMAAALEKFGTEHKIKLYVDGDHFLTDFKDDIAQEIISWFAKYKK